MQQDHAEALLNLAAATLSDQESVSLLSKTIADLISQIATLTNNLEAANKTIIVLKSGGGNRNGGGNKSGTSASDSKNNGSDTNKIDRNV